MRLPLVAVALAAASCAGPRTPAHVEHAQSLERGGDDGAALEAWRAIRLGCEQRPPAKDPKDECGLAATREAQCLERLDRFAEAAAAWEAVPTRAREPRKGARALARAAEIRLEKLGQAERARELAWRCVERYPDEVPSDDALALAVGIDRGRDPAALLARLDGLAARLARLDIADNLLLHAADLARDRGDRRGAVERYDRLARDYPRSSLSDDAAWRAAGLLRDLGDPQGAVDRLERILRTRRTAWIVGSYNFLYLDDAQLLAGQIWRDDLHRRDRAIAAFTALVEKHKDSRLRDDGLWELAATLLAGGDPEDRARGCAALDRILRELPDGNRARAAGERRAEAGCR